MKLYNFCYVYNYVCRHTKCFLCSLLESITPTGERCLQQLSLVLLDLFIFIKSPYQIKRICRNTFSDRILIWENNGSMKHSIVVNLCLNIFSQFSLDQELINGIISYVDAGNIRDRFQIPYLLTCFKFLRSSKLIQGL